MNEEFDYLRTFGVKDVLDGGLLEKAESPYINFARRRWPYLPAETYVYLHSFVKESPRVILPGELFNKIEVDIETVNGIKMGVGFDTVSGRVVLLVDEVMKEIVAGFSSL